MPIHTESQQRHRAADHGLRIVKYRETSRWFHQYGPYALVDGGNCIVASGLDADEIRAAVVAASD